MLRNDGSDLAHVGAETRRRVLDAIARTGYAADPIAQRMAKGRNRIVGVFTYERAFPRGAAPRRRQRLCRSAATASQVRNTPGRLIAFQQLLADGLGCQLEWSAAVRRDPGGSAILKDWAYDPATGIA